MTDLLTTGTEVTDDTLSMVIARAWSDEQYLHRLVEAPRDVLAEEGYEVSPDVEVRVLVDEPRISHFVVTRQTTDATAVAEALATRFPIPDTEEIRLVQSSDQLRYLVVPRRPESLGARIEAELDLVNKKPDDSANVYTDVEAATVEAEAQTTTTTTTAEAEAEAVVVIVLS